ncbi:MAG: YcxB family protein [Aureispira sp.]|nr:YcxB family protein [Aureispira sp.]
MKKIKTIPIEVTPSEHVHISIKSVFHKRRVNFFAMTIALGLVLSILQPSILHISILVIFTLIPTVFLILILYTAYNPKNKSMYQRRHYEIDAETISVTSENGKKAVRKTSEILYIVKIKDNYLIFPSKTESFYYPKRGFSTSEDFENFKLLITQFDAKHF